MKIKINTFKLAIGFAILSGTQSNAFAHGWSEFPNARQNICYEQDGIWWGTPPNEACANAKDISGSYPFVQRNEYSENITDYNNIKAVKIAIPDGTLCYANDPLKRGMGAAHTGWTRTNVNAGEFEYIFNASAAHDNHFWEFYLTKDDADLSKELAWGDLELIQTHGNIPVSGGKYRMNVTIPQDRVGDAILYVRWQRIDAVGEGFYNCSDITITNNDVILPEPPPEPTPIPDLTKGAKFISDNFGQPQVGNIVKYDIYNKHGNIARSFDIEIDSSNYAVWDRLLASEINGWHEQYKDSAIFIGDWHEEMNHYMYFKDDSSRNFFNSKDGRASAVMTLFNNDSEQDEVLKGKMYELSESDKVIKAGESAIFVFEERVEFTLTQGSPVDITYNGNTVIIKTGSITTNETLVFTAKAVNSESSGIFIFEVIADGETVTPDSNAWDLSKIYIGGEIVTYNNSAWKAQWWVQGGETPKAVYEQNQWGVWRPSN